MSATFLIFLFFVIIAAKRVEIQCPSHCECDIFENLKRATCTHKNLAGIESHLPQQSQILDISNNQISHLDDRAFLNQNLTSLKLLNISHNKVSQIHWRAFEGLPEIKTLDLSYNSVHYLKWFSFLPKLEELYLRGNHFRTIEGEPLVKSTSLKILDLSRCQITYLGNDVFAKLPNLEVLDLSENFLLGLSLETIKPLTNLTVLSIENNTMICDDNLTKHCRNHGIRFRSSCKSKIFKMDKLARISNAVEPKLEKNSWIYEDGEAVTPNVTLTEFNCTKKADKSLLQEIVDLSPILSILIPFIYGVAIGMIIGCYVQMKGGKRQQLNDDDSQHFEDSASNLGRPGTVSLTRRLSRRFSKSVTRIGTYNERVSLPLKEWKLSESTPVLNRKGQINS